jgi:protein-S-isoprenylcysteine O-methyltransferase Ste14
MSAKSLWKGSRGEWYLVVQAGIFLLLAFGPRTCSDVALWVSNPLISSVGGGLLFFAGALLAATGTFNLGRNLTPLPIPKDNATLIVGGAYRLVRHPIYSGLIYMAFGWSLWLHSWLTIGYALLLFVFFDVKSRYEERLLVEKFPEYPAYRTRVNKLIPFIY